MRQIAGSDDEERREGRDVEISEGTVHLIEEEALLRLPHDVRGKGHTPCPRGRVPRDCARRLLVPVGEEEGQLQLQIRVRLIRQWGKTARCGLLVDSVVEKSDEIVLRKRQIVLVDGMEGIVGMERMDCEGIAHHFKHKRDPSRVALAGIQREWNELVYIRDSNHMIQLKLTTERLHLLLIVSPRRSE